MTRKFFGDEKIDPHCEEPLPARFVLLRHDWPEPHRDFILEWPGEQGQERLSTWALYPESPGEEAFSADRSTAGRAVPLAPHRADYLHYEGPVSGNRGQVSRECAGVIIRAERNERSGSTIVLRIEHMVRTIEGTLKIERAEVGDKTLSIPVGPPHERAAASGMVFSWAPTCSPRSVEEDSGTETQGR